MTDRELLELAAKAAGIEVTGWDNLLGCQYVSGSEDSPFTDYWNPLADDGDALRLAVKMDLIVDTHGMHTRVSLPYDTLRLAIESQGNDPCAATRRAIVRAAAEIGKGMK